MYDRFSGVRPSELTAEEFMALGSAPQCDVRDDLVREYELTKEFLSLAAADLGASEQTVESVMRAVCDAGDADLGDMMRRLRCVWEVPGYPLNRMMSCI